jgi:hypothetical protein
MVKLMGIQIWEEATESLRLLFVDKYFGKDPEHYWIADDIGGVLFVNDYFFNLSDIVDFLKYNYSVKKMFEYYDYSLKCSQENKVPINIKNYIKLKNGKRKLS